MRTRTIGSAQVGCIGLGGMPWSMAEHPSDDARSIATLHAALDAGVTLIDTADAYTKDGTDPGQNERLVARGLKEYGGDTSHVLVATKGGHTRQAGGGWDVDGRPEHLRAACDASLRALGVDVIGLYQHHRPDRKVPYAETIGALKELHTAGKVRMVGISNANLEQIALAQQILGDGVLASVQNQFSPSFRSSEAELRYCAEQGIAFLPWSPLGGVGSAGELGGRFAPFAEVAKELGVSPQQVCLAWELAKADVVVPIPGASKPHNARDSAAAADLALSAEQLSRLDAS